LSTKEREVTDMGTRSTIAFIDKRVAKNIYENEIVRIYQQYDGYPSGVGLKLANWLKDKTVVNGFSMNQTMDNGFCNGIGCMSAQFIHDFKTDIGGLYITDHDDTEDYNYKVVVTYDIPSDTHEITLEAYRWDDNTPFFSGTPQEFIDMVINGVIED
jgi:hypothetical protein